MARILIGTTPGHGHVNPFLPLARALVARGHEVRWYTGAKYQDRITGTGATFAPLQYANDIEDPGFSQIFPDRKHYNAVQHMKFDLKHFFFDNGLDQLRDVHAIMRDFRADLILGDPVFIGGILYFEQTGTPYAVLNMLPMSLTSRDTVPYGLGMAPNASLFGRLRNRGLEWAIEHLLLADLQRYWNQVRAKIGLPPSEWVLDVLKRVPLYMQPSIPSFEYPRSDLPRTVHFIGMMPTEAPHQWSAPDWWGELDGNRPVVHVTQGTVANGTPELLAPTLAGLAGDPVLVVATTGGKPAAELGLEKVPANARVATFLSYPELLPRTAAMVTNGGYGGVQIALSQGVPLAVAGETEDKPEVAARVAWSGAGINLKTARPTPEQVRDAVRALLSDGRYRERARALQAEYARHNAVARSVELVEQLATTGKPVLRGEDAPRTAEAQMKSTATR